MKKLVLGFILLCVLGVGAVIFKKNFSPFTSHSSPYKGGNMKLKTVFEDGANIPSEYTCDGENSAPELVVSEVPQNAKSLVLIVDDPDAPMGTWVHWVLFNIPVTTTTINAKNLPQGVKQGTTDFGKPGWGGPCPPNGVHRYFFKLYAVDKIVDLPEGVTKSQVEKAIKDNVLEKAQIIGLYKRK